MATKDADLATDYADTSVYLSEITQAMFSAAVINVPAQTALPVVYMAQVGVGGGASLSYRMRGYDTTLSSTVFWSSSTPDADSSDYLGPGPVINIVVRSVSGE